MTSVPPNLARYLEHPKVAPGVYYDGEYSASYNNLSAVSWCPRDKRDLRRLQRADVLTRRAVLDAWVDPARAQRDLAASSRVYAQPHDVQGMANACIAHADSRRGSARKTARGRHSVGCLPLRSARAGAGGVLQYCGPLRAAIGRI